MADVVTDLSQLNGWFKVKYGEFFDLIPAHEKLTSKLGRIRKAERVGSAFKFPVDLVLPQGVTYSRTGQGAFTISDAVAGEMSEASVDGSQVVVNDVLSYEAAAKAQSEGEEAFGDSAGRVMKRLQKSGHKRIELDMWYGQKTLGTLSAISGTSTTRTFTISAATWAPGIWVGMKNARIDVWDTAAFGDLLTDSATDCIITAVDIANRQISVSGDSADLGDIDTGIGSSPVIVFKGTVVNSTTYNSMVGVDKICTTSGGTLFGVTQTELFTANSYDVGSTQLTLKKIYDGVGDSAAKLGEESDLDVWVSIPTFNGLAADQASLRRYGAEVKNAENGARSLVFSGPTGNLNVLPYTLIKGGEAFAMPTDKLFKVGAMDLGFNVPGRGEQFFENVPNKAGYRLQMYAHLAIACAAPGGMTKFTGIVNS